MKTVKYKGKTYHVLAENDVRVTLGENEDYCFSCLKDEVIYEKEPEEVLATEPQPTNEIIDKLKETPLPSEREEAKDLLPLDQVSPSGPIGKSSETKLKIEKMKEVQSITQDYRLSDIEQYEKVKDIICTKTEETDPNENKKEKEETDKEFTDREFPEPASIGDATDPVGVYATEGNLDENMTPEDFSKMGYPAFSALNVAPETREDREKKNAERLKGFIGNFKSRLEEMLKEMDSTEIKEDGAAAGGTGAAPAGGSSPTGTTSPAASSPETGTHSSDIATLKLPIGANVDPVGYPKKLKKLEEDGAGTASVAGTGCADGTVSPASVAQQGIARFDARLGAQGPYYPKKKVEENFEEFKAATGYVAEPLSEMKKLDESCVSSINRRILCELVLEKISPLNENKECIKERRRALREALGPFPTLRECAKFITEKTYKCGEGFVSTGRVFANNEEHLIKEMLKIQQKLFNTIKRKPTTKPLTPVIKNEAVMPPPVSTVAPTSPADKVAPAVVVVQKTV